MKPYIICHMMASVDYRIDGRKGMAAVFDGIDEQPDRPATLLKLQTVERMGDTVWMRYKI